MPRGHVSTPPKPDYINVDAVAKLFKVGRRTVHRWADAGKLECYVDARGWRWFSRAHVDAKYDTQEQWRP